MCFLVGVTVLIANGLAAAEIPSNRACSSIVENNKQCETQQAVLPSRALSALQLQKAVQREGDSSPQASGGISQRKTDREYINSLLQSYNTIGNRTMKQAYERCRTALSPIEGSNLSQKPFTNALMCTMREEHPRAVGFLLPKVASSSIREDESLAEAGFQTVPCHQVSEKHASLLQDKDVFRFAVIRDPLSRFVSSFNQISLEVLDLNRTVGRPLLRPSPAKDANVRFSDFLEDVLKQGNIHQIVFTEPQMALLMQHSESELLPLSLPPLDFIISLEELDSQWDEMMRELGIRNHGPPKSVKYRERVDRYGRIDTAEGVTAILQDPSALLAFGNLYAADFVCFGFTLPDGINFDGMQTQLETWLETDEHLSRELNMGAARLA